MNKGIKLTAVVGLLWTVQVMVGLSSEAQAGLLSDEAIIQLAIEEGKLVAPDGAENDFVGFSADIFENFAVVGAPYHDLLLDNVTLTNAGAVYVYEHDGNQWMFKQKLISSGADDNHLFGAAVSVENTHLIVGAQKDHDHGGSRGSATAFEYDGNNWVETQKITPIDLAGEWFGTAVSISGNRAMISALKDSSNTAEGGSVYEFIYDGMEWVEGQKIYASGDGEYERFGFSLSLKGDRMVVGAYFGREADEAPGAAYVYDYDNENSIWVETQKLMQDTPSDQSYFGNAVDFSGDWLVVGARRNDGDVSFGGAAYVFHYNGSSWSQFKRITEPDTGTGDEFGNVVNLKGERMLIGSNRENYNGTTSGAVYVYDLIDSDWVRTEKIIGSETVDRDQFGFSMGTSKGKAVIGAYKEDGLTVETGSAYVIDLPLPVKVTVQGLASGNELMLQNNGADDLNITENGHAIFGALMSAGTNYQVTVAQQPSSPNQSCEITQNNSLIQGDGINHVQVNCVMTPYFVAGTVSGLFHGNQMTLQNINQESLVINASGAFSFAVPVIDEQTYGVSITVMPMNPIQPCEISNESGTINGADVSDVRVNCSAGDDLIFSDGFEPIEE